MPINQIISDSSLSTVIFGRGFEIYRKLASWNGLTQKEKSLIAILNKGMALSASFNEILRTNRYFALLVLQFSTR